MIDRYISITYHQMLPYCIYKTNSGILYMLVALKVVSLELETKTYSTVLTIP